MMDWSKIKGPITAKEYVRLCDQDPEYQEKRRKWEAERQVHIKASMKASEAILKELHQVGITVETVSELFNRNIDYRSALPILYRWLPKVENKAVKESIIRALTVRWARPQAATPLIEEWKKINAGTELTLKWAIGNALETVADDSVFDDLVVMLRDKREGRAREMIARALWRMKNPQALDLLIELLDDEDVAPQALYSLGRMKGKAITARGKVETLLTHPNKWIRDAAKKTLSAFDKVR